MCACGDTTEDNLCYHSSGTVHMFLVCFWDGVSHDLELMSRLGPLGSECQGSVCVSLPSTGIVTHTNMPNSFNWVQEIELRPSRCKTSTQTELSLQPEDWAFYTALLLSHLFHLTIFFTFKVKSTSHIFFSLLPSLFLFLVFLRQVLLYSSVWPGTCYV